MIKKTANANRREINRVEQRAKNKTGISYASRGAGRASEHFETGGGKHATRNSRKHQAGKGDRRKTKEQRITSG
jgi:hypothetical protein